MVWAWQKGGTGSMAVWVEGAVVVVAAQLIDVVGGHKRHLTFHLGAKLYGAREIHLLMAPIQLSIDQVQTRRTCNGWLKLG